MSSGKESAAKYLESKYNFRCINIDKLEQDFFDNILTKNEENLINKNEIDNFCLPFTPTDKENIDFIPVEEETSKNQKHSFNLSTDTSEIKQNVGLALKKQIKSSPVKNNKYISYPKHKTSHTDVKAKHNKLVDLITLSYQMNNFPNSNENINNFELELENNQNQYNIDEKNLSICLSTSIIEYDNPEKNINLLKEKIREITDNFAVVHPLKKMEDYEELNRNYFRLINVDAPVKKRYENFIKKHINFESDPNNFQKFLEEENNYYTQNSDIKEMQTFANYHVSNDSTIEEFYKKLDNLSSTLHQTFRPNWDDYFMKITLAVSDRSNCMKQRIGAIIVKDYRIISTGYNGMSSSLGNCYLGNCPRCNIKTRQGENLHNCICIHAEESAIIELGTDICKGAILYTTNYPCLLCTKMIVKAEISEIVYYREYNSEFTTIMLEKAGIKIKKWDKVHNYY